MVYAVLFLSAVGNASVLWQLQARRPIHRAYGRWVAIVAATVVATPAQPLAADPAISSEVRIDQRTTSTVFSDRWPHPAVAFDGENFLVVWIDRRHVETTDEISTYRVYGARVDRTGRLLDPFGIEIAIAPGAGRPEVAFDGTSYLVVWQERRGSAPEIRGARVSTTGVPLDTRSFAISLGESRAYAPKVAFDGTNYLVVWYETNGGSVRGVRVTPAGGVLDEGDLELSSGPSLHTNPAVACDGTNCLVVWEESPESGGGPRIGGTRVSKMGVALDRTSVIDVARGSSPAAAFNGTDYVLAWGGGTGGVVAARVSASGEVLDPAGIQLTSPFLISNSPAIACHGLGCLVTWRVSTESTRHVRGSIVTTSGSTSALWGVELWTELEASISVELAVAFDGDDYLVVWSTGAPGWAYPDVVAARVDTSAAVVGETPLTVARGATGEGEPAAAFDGTNYLVVWQDSRNGNDDIYAARVAADGTLLDHVPIAVSTEPAAQRRPRVAFGGTNYLVVWEDRRSHSDSDIYAARVSPEGELLDPSGIVLSAAPGEQRLPAVLGGPGCDEYLVVWADARGGELYATRVSSPGAARDPMGVMIGPTAPEVYAPAIAFDGAHHLVVWSARGDGGDRDIFAVRVGDAGTAFDAVPIVVGADVGDQRAPSVTFGGSNYLVAWENLREAHSYQWQISGIRVRRDGLPIESASFPITIPSGPQYRPAVAFDGIDYVVAWQRTVGQGLPNIEAVRVMLDGSQRDAEPFMVTTGIGGNSGSGAAETAAAVVSAGSGRTLVLYRASDEPNYGRTWHPGARRIDSDVAGGAGDEAAEGIACGDPEPGVQARPHADAGGVDASAPPEDLDGGRQQHDAGVALIPDSGGAASVPSKGLDGERRQHDAGVTLGPQPDRQASAPGPAGRGAAVDRDGGASSARDASAAPSRASRSSCRCDLVRARRQSPSPPFALAPLSAAFALIGRRRRNAGQRSIGA